MPNRIPQKTRQAVYNRANYACELCGNTTMIDGIHHIIPRRKGIHREETLILSCKRCHDIAENDANGFQKQLQVSLQKFYASLGYTENETRRLMGGKLYLYEGEVADIIKSHFASLNTDRIKNKLKGVI